MVESARIARDPAEDFAAIVAAGVPGERNYRREMIATYVFAKRGDVRSHIPPPLLGPLVPMSPSSRAALRQQLRAALLKSS
jgi:hypothetical protein